MKEIKEYTDKMFEDIKHIDEEGNEYRYSRELMPILEYSKWENFNKVIEQAKIACKNSGVDIKEQFPEVGKLSTNVNGGKRKIVDYKLSRYACYLIAQTDAKLKRDRVDNEYEANYVHYQVGKKVRNPIKELGGTILEDLPTPNISLKEIEKNNL